MEMKENSPASEAMSRRSSKGSSSYGREQHRAEILATIISKARVVCSLPALDLMTWSPQYRPGARSWPTCPADGLMNVTAALCEAIAFEAHSALRRYIKRGNN